MQADQQLLALDELLELSQQIYDAAATEDWQAVDEKDKLRLIKLKAFFGGDNDPHNVPELRVAIERMVLLNTQAEACCEQAREQVRQQLKQLSTGKQAVSAYQNEKIASALLLG